MKTILRSVFGLSIVCLAGSVAALVAGVGRFEDRPPLRFDPDPFVLPVSAGWPGEHDFEVAVVNDSGEPARIVGAEAYCGRVACFAGIGLPATIPQRGRACVTIRVKSGRPGPISEKLTFFTDRPSQPRLTIRIEGTILEGSPLEIPTQAASP